MENDELEQRAALCAQEVLETAARESAAHGVPITTARIAHYVDSRTLAMLRPDQPGMTLPFRRAINRHLAEGLVDRGITFQVFEVTIGGYLAWLDGRADSFENRLEYVQVGGRPLEADEAAEALAG